MLDKLTDVLGGSLLDGFSKIISNFKLSPEKKAEMEAAFRANETVIQKAEIELDAAIQETIRSEINAKKDIMVAEIQSGSAYVRNARPSIIYTGLAVIVLNHCLLPWIAHCTGHGIPDIQLPLAFRTAWGGITGTFVIGRTVERRGTTNKLIQMMTGNKALENPAKIFGY